MIIKSGSGAKPVRRSHADQGVFSRAGQVVVQVRQLFLPGAFLLGLLRARAGSGLRPVTGESAGLGPFRDALAGIKGTLVGHASEVVVGGAGGVTCFVAGDPRHLSRH